MFNFKSTTEDKLHSTCGQRQKTMESMRRHKNRKNKISIKENQIQVDEKV